MQRNDFRIAIVGAGGIGCATAAYLRASGLPVAMWSPTGRRLRPHAQPGRARFDCVGALDGAVAVERLARLADLSDYSHVFICLPASHYQQVLQDAAPHWRDGQTLIVSGALSLVPLWLRQTAAAHGADVTAVGWSTTLTTAHFLPDGRLHLNAPRGQIGMAWLAPPEGDSDALADCRALFGDRFAPADNLLASTLANINPIAHAAEVIPNLTRMDRGEAWPLFGHFTGVVANMAQALDRERLALAQALGFTLPTLAQHYSRSYHVPLGPLEDIARAIDARGAGPLGPARLAHRYVLEDVPFGLVFQERLARLLGVDCPLLSACITLLEAVYAESFRDRNYLLAELLPEGMSAEALLAACRSACAAS